MKRSLLLSVLSVFLPLAASAPNHGHSHAQAHRDLLDSVQLDRSHIHGHSHREIHNALAAAPAVNPRSNPPLGCGGRPKHKGTGKGKPKTGPTGPLSNVGGMSPTGAPGYVTGSPPQQSNYTAVEPSPNTPTRDPVVLQTSIPVVEAAAVPTNSNFLEAFQATPTLMTSYSPASAYAPAAAVETLTANVGSGSGSGADNYSAAAPQPTGDPDNLTIFLVNKMDCHLTTSHGMNDGLPDFVQLIKATLTDGLMAPAETALLVYPAGWAGNMAAAKAPTSDDDVVDLANGSLLEGSFVSQMDDTPVGDIDVSYVSGYSVPITCECENAKRATVTFGCSVDLFDEGDASDSGPCPDTCFDGSSSCLVGSTCNNPLRALDVDGLTPAPFFQRCQGAAFTYARDTANSQNSQCTTNYISCCIGSAEDGCPQWNSTSDSKLDSLDKS